MRQSKTISSESGCDGNKAFQKKLTHRVHWQHFREDIQSIELHAFGDASGEGVSSVVYAVVRQPSGVSQGLVAAKARLAKQGLTIPRLELVSVHMAANLVGNVQRALEGFPVTVLQGWLDSTVALHWIMRGNFKQFVANRVAKIKSNTQLEWRHVPTKENPADLGSRGGPVKGNQLWWKGPEWLADRKNWPCDIVTSATKESDAETKVIREIFAATVEETNEVEDLLTKFDLWKTLRICSWIARFTFNCRSPNQKRRGPLTTPEIASQRLLWIKRAQSSCNLEEDRLQLNLQANRDGVLVCRGRIQGHYPVYVPDTSLLAEKLVQDSHLRTLHGGIGMTMTHIRSKYWIPRLRQLTRKAVKNCYGCRRFERKR